MSNPAKTIKKKIFLSALPLFFLAFLPLRALAQTGIAAVHAPAGAYDLEMAEFSYGVGNFLDASIMTKSILAGENDESVKQRALIIKLLSDINLSVVEMIDAPEPGVSLAAKPELSEFFKALYERGQYGEMERLIKDTSGSEAAYLKSLVLYRNGKYIEAEDTLQGIPASSQFFPYARLLLSEIMLVKNDVKSAISHLDMKDERLAGAKVSNTIRLYKGYLLFESGNFLAAEQSFLDVDGKSAFSKKALAGGAWSSLKRGDCDKALHIMDRLKPFDPSDEESRELMLAEAYCAFKTGNALEAEKIVLKAVASFDGIEAGCGAFSDINALLKENPAALLKDASLCPNSALKSLRNATTAKNAEEVKLLLSKYEAIERIAAAYDKKEGDINLALSSIEPAILIRREGFAEIKAHITKIKPLLKTLTDKTLEKTSTGYEIRKPSPMESAEEPSIVELWEKTINRKLSAQERQIIRMMLLDGKEGAWYLNDTQYAQPLFWMAIDKSKNAPVAPAPGYPSKGWVSASRAKKGPLEHMAEDVFASVRNKPLSVEQMAHDLEEASAKKIKVKAKEKVLDGMLELKANISSDRELIENAINEINLSAAEIMSKRVLMLTYDIRTVKKKAALLLNDIRKQTAEKRRTQ